MAPNERARKNHDELFPGHVSTLAVTDPELIESFENFAFDESAAAWQSGHPNPADGSARLDNCLSGAVRIPRHARGGA